MNRAILILALVLTGCATQQLTHGIPNFAVVSPGIYRGGQPTDAGWLWLASQGVTNDVKLNTKSEASDATAVLCHMRLFPCPVTLPRQLGLEPMPRDLFFDDCLVALPASGTFVHCEHGQDRTGLFVAMWRVRWEGWTKADAEKEMLAHGFHKVLRGLWKNWEEFKPFGQ